MRALYDWRGHSWLALAARLYLGLVFVVASWHKIRDPAGFALDVATYQLLPLQLINLQALILPWVELITGAMLIVGFRTRASALLICGMMLMFIAALSWALYLNLDMSCGCFASASEADSISYLTVLRDLSWLFLGLYVLLFDRRPLGLDRFLFHRAKTA